MGKNVLITGATGMVGGLAMERCLGSGDVARVTSLGRRFSGIQHQKLTEVIVDDFLNLEPHMVHFESVDVVLYCLGVYTGAVDQVEFHRVTVEYPELLARAVQRNNPVFSFCLLSGAGADRTERSRIMFAREKGRVENRLAGMGLGALHCFRPGYIYPVAPRKEPNLSYRMMRLAYPFINLIWPDASVRSTALAEAMFRAGLYGADKEILENADIVRMATAASEVSG